MHLVASKVPQNLIKIYVANTFVDEDVFVLVTFAQVKVDLVAWVFLAFEYNLLMHATNAKFHLIVVAC